MIGCRHYQAGTPDLQDGQERSSYRKDLAAYRCSGNILCVIYCVTHTQDSESSFLEAHGALSRQKSLYPQSNLGPGRAWDEDIYRTRDPQPEVHTLLQEQYIYLTSVTRLTELWQDTAPTSASFPQMSRTMLNRLKATQVPFPGVLTNPTSGQETDLWV